MNDPAACTGECEHLRSFRFGFDQEKLLYPFNIRDRLATCALQPELTLYMMAMPRCWREESAC